jgi:hypothetical protein
MDDQSKILSIAFDIIPGDYDNVDFQPKVIQSRRECKYENCGTFQRFHTSWERNERLAR